MTAVLWLLVIDAVTDSLIPYPLFIVLPFAVGFLLSHLILMFDEKVA